MKVVLQRVKNAYVKVDSKIVSEINNGLLLFWGIEELDTEVESEILINKILNFRIFADENLKMNKSIIDISGEVLIVSQFTLAGKFLKGNRPSFVNAKDPKIAEDMITSIVNEFSKHLTIKTGSFGAMMDVGLVNDGPVTITIDSEEVNFKRKIKRPCDDEDNNKNNNKKKEKMKTKKKNIDEEMTSTTTSVDMATKMIRETNLVNSNDNNNKKKKDGGDVDNMGTLTFPSTT